VLAAASLRPSTACPACTKSDGTQGRIWPTRAGMAPVAGAQVGDVLKTCSAVFGEDMWPAQDIRRVHWAINNRSSKVRGVGRGLRPRAASESGCTVHRARVNRSSKVRAGAQGPWMLRGHMGMLARVGKHPLRPCAPTGCCTAAPSQRRVLRSCTLRGAGCSARPLPGLRAPSNRARHAYPTLKGVVPCECCLLMSSGR